MSPTECVTGEASQWRGNLEKQVWWPRGGSGWALWTLESSPSLPPSARELRVVLGDAVLECREPRLLGAAVGIEVERLRGRAWRSNRVREGSPESPTEKSQGRRRRSCRRGRKQECGGHERREGDRTAGHLQRRPLPSSGQVRCPLPAITRDLGDAGCVQAEGAGHRGQSGCFREGRL